MNHMYKVTAFAEGAYSGSTYHEEVMLTPAIYEKMADYLSEFEMTVSELDGKHSETNCEISVDIIDKSSAYRPSENDGDLMYEAFYSECVCGDENIISKEEWYELEQEVGKLRPGKIRIELLLMAEECDRVYEFIKEMRGDA